MCPEGVFANILYETLLVPVTPDIFVAYSPEGAGTVTKIAKLVPAYLVNGTADDTK